MGYGLACRAGPVSVREAVQDRRLQQASFKSLEDRVAGHLVMAMARAERRPGHTWT